MAFALGFDAKMYRQTSGTRAAWPGTGAAPNLDLISNVRDVTVTLDKTEADVTTRGGDGWRQTIAALKELTVEWEMVYDTTDADFLAVLASFTGNTTIALAVLDGGSTTVGTKGFWADFMISGAEKSEPLEGAQTIKFTAKSTYSAVAPAFITVA